MFYWCGSITYKNSFANDMQNETDKEHEMKWKWNMCSRVTESLAVCNISYDGIKMLTQFVLYTPLF